MGLAGHANGFSLLINSLRMGARYSIESQPPGQVVGIPGLTVLSLPATARDIVA